MYVTGLRIEGLKGAPAALWGLSRVAPLPAHPAAVAVADALTLLHGGLHADYADAVGPLGWATGPIERWTEGEDVEVRGLNAEAVSGFIDGGSVVVDVDLHLDPPLFGRLRNEAIRDPRVVTALGQSPTLSVKVGWLLSADRTMVAPSVLGVRVGQVAFDPRGKERPTWLPALLRDLGTRFHRTGLQRSEEVVTARLLAAAQSVDPEERAGFRAVAAALAAPPFALPALDFVRVDGKAYLAFGSELWRGRQLGRAAIDAVRWATGAWLERPDVLIVDEVVPEPVHAWLTALPEGENAPVEQVWVP